MKINITKEKLSEGIQIIQSSVAGKTTLPILFNFLIEAQDGTIKLTRTDMEMAIIHTFKAEVVENGSITIPLKDFSDILKNLPSGKEIVLESDEDNKLHIKSGRSKFWLIGTPKSEYPLIPEIEKNDSFSIKVNILKEMIEKTIFSAAIEETRYILNGLLWNNTKDKFEVVATDGRRLSLYINKVLEGVKEFKIIVPKKILNEVLKLISLNKFKEDENINITTSVNQISFTIKDTVLISRLIEGNYPNYEQVIPSKKNISFSSETSDILSSTKSASVCASDLGGTVKYKLTENNILITSNSSKMSFSDEIKINYTGEDFETSFNPQYLIDVLKNINTDKVNFSFVNATQPVLIEPEGETKYKYIIMPVRV